MSIMDLSYSHAQSQRILKQRNVLVGVSLGLVALSALLGVAAVSRDPGDHPGAGAAITADIVERGRKPRIS